MTKGVKTNYRITHEDSQCHTRTLVSYLELYAGSSNVKEKLVKGPLSLPFPLPHTCIYMHTRMHIVDMLAE